MGYSGRYTVQFPDKYVGNVNEVIYRSLWERKVMRYLDNNSNIISWGSEELYVPYQSPKDGRMHRYYIDFYVKAQTKDGIKEMLWEVKPERQTKPPVPVKEGKRKKPKRRHRYLVESVTYGINLAKWDAAQKFCAKQGWEFKILTEKELAILH